MTGRLGARQAGASLAQTDPGIAARLLIAIVARYRRSDLLHRGAPRCTFIPSCSEYSLRALRKYGAMKGSLLTIQRLRRCRPSYTGSRVDFP